MSTKMPGPKGLVENHIGDLGDDMGLVLCQHYLAAVLMSKRSAVLLVIYACPSAGMEVMACLCVHEPAEPFGGGRGYAQHATLGW